MIKVKSLTDAQMAYIDQNWQTQNRVQMADAVGAKVCTVEYYCYQNDYRKVQNKNEVEEKEPAKNRKAIVKVKCLDLRQMKYIMDNHLTMTAAVMADYLKVEHHKVTLFCQVNDIQPKEDRVTKFRKKKDSFHFHRPIRKRITRAPECEKSDFKRVKGVYGNRSQTEVINYYANLKIA